MVAFCVETILNNKFELVPNAELAAEVRNRVIHIVYNAFYPQKGVPAWNPQGFGFFWGGEYDVQGFLGMV